MGLTLQKGQTLSLTKTEPGLTKLTVGLGWDVRTTVGAAYDLDASALLLNASGKVRSDADFVFYGQPSAADGAVASTGDNRTGEGDGDDEQITVDLARIPADVEKVVIVVSIYDADARKQNFGAVRNAYIRLVNDDSGSEVVRYDLSEDYSTETALTFAEIYRNSGEWKFRAVDQGYADGLGGVARDYGVNIEG